MTSTKIIQDHIDMQLDAAVSPIDVVSRHHQFIHHMMIADVGQHRLPVVKCRRRRCHHDLLATIHVSTRLHQCSCSRFPSRQRCLGSRDQCESSRHLDHQPSTLLDLRLSQCSRQMQQDSRQTCSIRMVNVEMSFELTIPSIAGIRVSRRHSTFGLVGRCALAPSWRPNFWSRRVSRRSRSSR